jgi:UDP-3-O-[3-hydroxymyristoyl] glucosamine N-acyltransferase
VSVKLSELLKKINIQFSLVGNDPEIHRVCSLEKGDHTAVSFLANPKYGTLVEKSAAVAIFVPLGFKGASGSILIPCESPSKTFSDVIIALGLQLPEPKRVISNKAEIHPSAKIGANCSIGAFCVIEANAILGDNTVLGPNCYVGLNAKIGSDCLFHPSVVVYHGCEVGSRVVIHSHTTIGSDGFGFELEGNVEKIPQVGIVIISDDVEIGANVSIDRARFDSTKIGRYTKIDNQVQIGHNVEIGQRCLIVAQVGIAGSCIIGNGVILAGQAGVAGHIKIGDKAVIAGKTGVGKDVKPGERISGHYGGPHQEQLKQYATMKQMPELMKKIKKLLK